MNIKMFGKKSFSTVLYYSTRFATIGYGIIILLVIILLLTNSYIITGDNVLEIQIPFTSAVIKGAYTLMALVGVLCFSIFYGAFFYVLSLIFKTFSTGKLFTEKAIKYLRWFTILNCSLPVIYIVTGLIINNNISAEGIVSVIPHIALGIFSAFIAAIFKQGFTIQEENELTI